MEVEGTVAVLTLSRPATLNAIDTAVLLELERLVANLEADRSLRTMVLTGNGRAFVAGGDVRQMRDLPVAEGRDFVETGHRVLDRIAASRLVSIAAINGFALGGGAELALACDLRVMATHAVIGFPEVMLGLFPAWGGTQRLVRQIGPGRARMLVFTGESVSAEEALRLGLVEKVVPSDELLETCRKLARAIAQSAPNALYQAKRSLLEGGAVGLAEGKRIEIEAWLANFASGDRIEGLSAFLERRKPEWRDG